MGWLGESDGGERECRDAVRTAIAASTRVSRARGTTAAATTPTTGATSTRATSHSLGVTEAPQGGGVAGAELGEDPLVEHACDECDQQEIDGDTDLDRERRLARE